MLPHEFIEGYEKIIERFGLWPSFHDGEVHRIVLDRTARSSAGSYFPTVEIHLRGWVMGPEVTEGGFYKLHNDSVVQFLFEDIFDFELEGFNQQNVLTSLNVSLIEDPRGGGQALHVELEHCYLFSAELSARKAKVLGVIPYVAPSAG
jgi:hypothetical protein